VKPIAVGIAGGSCSGKSTLANRLFQELGPSQSLVLPQDDYFFGLGNASQPRAVSNFDHPDAVDFSNMCRQLTALKSGLAIDRPLYDFPTHLRRQETLRIESRPIILVDGTLVLQHQSMRTLLDYRIFVESDAPTRLSRRTKRDVEERGRTAVSVIRVFAEQVNPMHERFVEPSRRHADILINSQQPKPLFEADCAAILRKIEALSH